MTRALIVLSSHERLGDTGRTTGFYLPEAAHPYKVFSEAGWTVEFVSPQGGKPPMDGVDLSDPVQQAFLDDPQIAAALTATSTPDHIDPGDYDVIFYAGGHGSMWDFPDNTRLAEVAAQLYEAGGVVAAVCHGPAALINIRLSDGAYLIDGRAVAAFTDDEERAVGLAQVVPFLLQTRLTDRGARHTGAPNFKPHVVADDRLITGQNPASATGVAERIVVLIRSRASA